MKQNSQQYSSMSSMSSMSSPPSPPPPGFFLGSRQRRRLQIIASDSRCIPATLAVLLFGCQRRLPCFSFEEIPVLPSPPTMRHYLLLPQTIFLSHLEPSFGCVGTSRYLSVPLGTSRLRHSSPSVQYHLLPALMRITVKPAETIFLINNALFF